jgi:hypothetical protein
MLSSTVKAIFSSKEKIILLVLLSPMRATDQTRSMLSRISLGAVQQCKRLFYSFAQDFRLASGSLNSPFRINLSTHNNPATMETEDHAFRAPRRPVQVLNPAFDLSNQLTAIEKDVNSADDLKESCYRKVFSVNEFFCCVYTYSINISVSKIVCC